MNDPKGYKVGRIVSKLGILKDRYVGGVRYYDIPEYPNLDLLKLYKPRTEGGLGYGKSQAAYTLDHISDVELEGLRKIDYNSDGLSLDMLFEKDPILFIKYNLVDVILVKKLNGKLQHIDLHNLLRRDMCDSFKHSTRGQSSFFEAYYSYILNKQGIMCKYNINSETTINISTSEINQIPQPKMKSIIVSEIGSLSEDDYKSIVNSYPGAYVKDVPDGALITENDGISIDLNIGVLSIVIYFVKFCELLESYIETIMFTNQQPSL